jgi:hypothetical protein
MGDLLSVKKIDETLARAVLGNSTGKNYRNCPINVIPAKAGTHTDCALPRAVSCCELTIGTGLRRYDGF